ncbi:major facilitator superfamily domain-containing protein [Lipomyces kononenkoae]
MTAPSSIPADLEKNKPSEPSTDPGQAKQNAGDTPVVSFEEGDPENPMNFRPWFKAWLTLEMGLLALAGSVGSSIITPAETAIASYLNISSEVAKRSFFTPGYAFGPLVWAPISELYGRKWSILPGVFALGLFSIGTATSRNAASIFITRFLGGVFGSAPISNTTASLGDFYHARERGVPMAFLAVCVVGGPTIAPLIGAALTVNPHLGWRWTEYIEAIFAFAMFLVAAFALPETYHPVLLRRKEARLRKGAGDPGHGPPMPSLTNIVTKHLTRPLRMLFTEPIVTCIALYASFVYGLLFLNLEVYPIVFHEHRQYSLVVSTLPLLGLFVGVVFALTINIANQPLYARAVMKNNGRAVPEARLPPMVVGGVMFSAGLFWFGWTAAPKYSWASPVVAGGFIGAGFNIVFQQCLNFLVDSYGAYGASAVSANNFLRSLMAFGLPLAARPMFLNLGVCPASSLLGGISCLALPVPFIFMKYGKKLRSMSKFAAKY